VNAVPQSLTLKQAIERAGEWGDHHGRDFEGAINLRVGTVLFKIGRPYRSEADLMKALIKDDPGSQAVDTMPFETKPPGPMAKRPKGGKMKAKKVVKMILGLVSKSPNGVTRGLIEGELHAAAVEIAKEDRIPVEAAEVRIWNKGGDRLREIYELAKVGAPKRADRGTMKVTRAEAQLDDLARKYMKVNGCTFPEAMGATMQARPDLYAEYEAQKASGQMFEVPNQPEHLGFTGNSVGQKRRKGADARWQSAADDLDDNDEDGNGNGDGDGKRKGRKSGGTSWADLAERDKAMAMHSMYDRR